MASRYSAARPKRAGEAFARAHHGERDDEDQSSKKVKFDVRNPSALAPDAREDDEVLEADVIGTGGTATKRGAVNIDGYDSDSENETFDARADAKGRKRGTDTANLLDQLDNYDPRRKMGDADKPADEDDDDMFAMNDDDGDDAEDGGRAAEATTTAGGKKNKEVRFLDADDIEGQEQSSRARTEVRLDDAAGGSSDEEEVELAIQEQGVDEEVGAGGLKKHAPKIDAFNMKQEQEEGGFDEAGNFLRKAQDPDAVHDRWLDGLSRRDMKKAAEAHEKREAELRHLRREDDSFLTSDLLGTLIRHLERAETVLEALARLGKVQAKFKPKKVPKWKQRKPKDGTGEAMDVDKAHEAEDPEHVKVKEAIAAVTDAADRLLNREYTDIYDTERELLMREYRKETGEDWVDPPEPDEEEVATSQMWEYRWTDGRDGGARQGPYDGVTMKAWQDAGYFGEGVEFRPVDETDTWSKIATFI